MVHEMRCFLCEMRSLERYLEMWIGLGMGVVMGMGIGIRN